MILSAPNYFKALLLCLFSFFFSGAAVAAPILSETVLTANSEGATAGSFDGGTATLTTAANLNVTGHTRNYVAQYFVPSASGSYQIGLSSSTEDTVIVLYTGAFSPTTPGLNATTVRDDYSGSRSPGVTMGTCGTQVSYCPQITENLVGGQTYYIVVTSYRPNRTVSDGVNMYIYGEPVTFGNKSQSDAATGLSSSVQIELTTRARSLINLDKNFFI